MLGFPPKKKETERLPVPVPGIPGIPDASGSPDSPSCAAFAEALNRSIEAFTANTGEALPDILSAGLRPVADAVGLDRISVYRRSYDVAHEATPLRPAYRWVRAEGGTAGVGDPTKFLQVNAMVAKWGKAFDGGGALCVRESAATAAEAEFLRSFGVKSMLIVPIFANGRRWGAVVFQYCEAERGFDEASERFLCSAARLCANTVIRAETEAAAAEVELTQILIDTTPLSCIMFSRDLSVLTCNNASVTLFEVESKEEVLRMFYNLSPEYQPCGRLSAEMAIELIRDTFDNGYNEVAWVHQTASGEPIPCESMLVRVKYRDDYVVAGYARDLRSIKEAEAKMRESDERTRVLFDAMPLCASYCDGGDRIVIDCNEEAVRFFGLKDKREYIDHFEDFSPAFQPDGRASGEAARELVARAFKDGSYRGEWMHQTLGGEPLPVELTLIRVKSRDEYVVAAYMRDLREQKALENFARAEAANRAKSSFLATMSHEMRTPMNAIIGMTTIGKGAQDIERKDYSLNKIEDAAKHLLSVINNVLDISKIEADKLELSPIEFNFERMLQRVVGVITFRVEEKHQRLGIRIDRKIPRFVVGDDNRLTQVIMNLLTNAVKFSPERGEINFEATLVSEADGVCELRVAVTDNGIGISDEQQSRLFGAFEQAERGISREFGGTGLGLAISKRIVELMGGKIWIESALGHGSKFIFTAKVGRGERGIRSMLAPGVSWENMRVLAVDDEPETCTYFTELFSQLGIKIDTAVDGLEACRLIEERGAYDIYFIDWRMPGMDGIELARRIKARVSERPSVAVMISAVDWSAIKETALEAGISKYLLKPLFSSAIIDCVHECLGIAGGEAGESAPEAPTGAPFEGKNLLVAEDVEINREILMLLLEDTGLAIDCAQNGIEAVDMITAAPDKYDLVFMDVQMPKMDGLEATRRIRAQGKVLPIVAMTANVFKSDVEQCLEAGMNDHIGKPIDIDAVMDKLRKYL